MPDFLCFNTDRRDYAGWYGADAFYDLELTPRENRKFGRLKPGDVCVVATYTTNRKNVVAFRWFSFLQDKPMLDPKPGPKQKPGTNARVLFGKPTKPAETFSKRDAAQVDPYSGFFKVKGRFKGDFKTGQTIIRSKKSKKRRP